MTYLETPGTFANVIKRHFHEIITQPSVKDIKKKAEEILKKESKRKGTRVDEYIAEMWRLSTPEQLTEFFINKMVNAALFNI